MPFCKSILPKYIAQKNNYMDELFVFIYLFYLFGFKIPDDSCCKKTVKTQF